MKKIVRTEDNKMFLQYYDKLMKFSRRLLSINSHFLFRRFFKVLTSGVPTGMYIRYLSKNTMYTTAVP